MNWKTLQAEFLPKKTKIAIINNWNFDDISIFRYYFEVELN